MAKMNKKVTEIKRHLNKPTERYECDLLESAAEHVKLRYVSDRTFASTRLGISFPPGCITVALYWERRPYVFWGIFTPEKELLGYLVHICRDVEISDETVSYLDMLLDIWFYPDGRHLILDEDEVEECHQLGKLDENDIQYIESARETAIADFESNTQTLNTFVATLDISAQHQ